MIVQVKIKSELIEWVANQTGMDQDEAHEFTKEFAGMLYFTGAFEGIEPRPELVEGLVLKSSANVNFKAEPCPELVEGPASSEGPGE